MSASRTNKGLTEPTWWLLFGAGAVCTALVVAPLILLVGLFPAAGWLPDDALSYARVHGLVHQPLGLVFVLTAIVLPVCQAMYRLRHSLHDLQLGRDAVARKLCYGAALLIGGSALWLWLLGL